MEKTNVKSIVDIFKDIEDRRIGPQHLLIEIIVITILASICDANSFVDVSNWGKANATWLKKYLKLPFGIPSHDTFSNVFRVLKPKQFEACFFNWMQQVQSITEGDVIAIDGKTLRGSYDKNAHRFAINMVSAWSSLNNTVLGQIKTETKSNEITAIPKLLEMLDINGCIITIDAAGCQEKITEVIVENGGDYVIALKDNQPTLFNSAQEHFEELLEKNHTALNFHSTSENGHGREDTKNYYVFDDIDELEGMEKFRDLAAIGVAENISKANGKITYGLRFYILSLVLTAKMFGACVRSHWAIENKLHWCLDVTFNEDASRIRKDHGAENMSIARRIALNLLRNNGDNKRSLRAKRKMAGWDQKYLQQVVGF